MVRTLRRLLIGFAIGAAAGWAASLFRTPRPAPAGSSAAAAGRLPLDDFGDAPGEPAAAPAPDTAGATEPAHPVAVPGGDAEPSAPAASDPAPSPATGRPKPVKAAAPTKPAKPAKPAKTAKMAKTAKTAKTAKPRAPRRAKAADPTAAAAEELRAGRSEATQKLAEIELPPAPPPPGPEARRRPARKRQSPPADDAEG